VRRRLFRWLFTLAAAVSLVLFLATAVMWVRSYFVLDDLLYASDRGGSGSYYSYRLSSIDGCLRVGWSRRPYLSAGEPGFYGGVSLPPRQPWMSPLQPGGCSFAKFYFLYRDLDVNGQHTDVALPYWFLAVILIIFPIWRLVRRTPRGGCCAKCGYDLRATPERCPECGIAPAAMLTRRGAAVHS